MKNTESFFKSISGWRFTFFLLTKLPMGWLAGLKVESLSENECVTSVPFKYLTKNPFKSTYFAVLSMAAELSTAVSCLLAVRGQQPSVAYIIVDHKGRFIKKATGKVFFTCTDTRKAFNAVKMAQMTKDPQTATFKTVGQMADGTIVAEYEFTWSFKSRTD